MKTTTTQTPEFNILPGAPSLLDQLATMIPTGDMPRVAKDAVGVLAMIEGVSAERQQSSVASYSLGALLATDLEDEHSRTVAVIAAALLGAAKAGPSTASERVRMAIVVLSARYDAEL